ncbi:serine hydrolase domain-containing protein [uncultured Draconibacterium sp.]|uniref:serine hydrolase domain-containing protein n=1 Tax=uncultured Draconibacterium sp. TaxID=1573823 RepID=UPI0032166B86
MYLSILNKSKQSLFLLALLMLTHCSSPTDIAEAKTEAEKLLQKEINKENVHNLFLNVYSPSLEIDWQYNYGKFKNGEAVTAANPFYTASIGKTFTAIAIAILVEEKRLKFEDKISNYLPEEIMLKLHVFDGKDISKEITIEQLLQHTSGLPDYFEGETTDGSPNVMEQLFTDQNKHWEPLETIALAKEKMKPLFEPGNGYNYTDTEYVLLGLIIEEVSKTPLHEFFRDRIFEPVNMVHTSMHLRSSPLKKTSRLSEIYVDDFETSSMKSLSADWAGGGLISTASDLIKFQHALFSGQLISVETLKTMQNWIPETYAMEYGFGLRKIAFRKLFPTLPDLTLVGHSGSTGSFMYYCPEMDVYLAGTLNQTDEVKNSVVLMVKILSGIYNTKDFDS